MKKTVLLCFLAFICFESFSQKVRIGLRFAPGFAYSRSSGPSDTLLNAKGAGVRFFGGPELNFVLGENYVFTTGLWYSSKRVGFILNDVSKQVYNVQYVQLPATLKLYTNDIAVDTKLYFQLGGTLDVKVASKPVKEEIYQLNKFNLFNSSVLLGAGVQYQVGTNTYLFGGLTYLRGLMNSVSFKKPINGKDAIFTQPLNLNGMKAAVKNDMIALDLGIRF